MLPEKWPVLGTPEQTAAGAEPLDGPALAWARATARELGIDLVAGSVAERVEGADRGANTSVHIGPDGEDRATYRKIHMFDVEVGGRTYRESEHEAPGDEPATSALADGTGLGLTICYDLRFPELYRILAVRGAKVITVPAAFTETTTRDHWEVLLRARAIEDQCFVVAANQVGEFAPGLRAGGRSMIVDPWGLVLAQAPDAETFVVADLDLGPARGDPDQAALARQPPGRRLPLARGGPRVKAAAVDKRRLILDAAVRVFARQGFHTCRVSDIADEAGVAYGLVYHYFQSKDEVLDTLFLERWELMLAAIDEIDAQPIGPREKLDGDRVVHRRLLPPRPRPDEGDHRRGHARGEHVRPDAPGGDPQGLRADRGHRRARAGGRHVPRRRSAPQFAAMAFYGAIEQVLTGWIFGLLEEGEDDYARAKRSIVETICDGLEAHHDGAPA